MLVSKADVTLRSWKSESDSFITIQPVKPVFECTEKPEIKIQYNLMYDFDRFENADEAKAALEMKYLLMSGSRLIGGGDVNDALGRNTKEDFYNFFEVL